MNSLPEPERKEAKIKTTRELVKFDFDIAVITALDAKYKNIQITDGKSYAIVMQGLAEYRDLRLAIDDKHKELKRDILEAGRSLDGDKNRLKALLEPGENHLKEVRQVEDDRKTAIKEEKDRKERERIEAIQEKIESIRSQGTVANYMTVSIIEERLIIVKALKIPPEFYKELTDQALQSRMFAISALEQALTERIQFEKEETERKAETERLEKVRKEQEAAQAKIDEENRKIEKEKAKIKAEKKAEEERKEREEFERQAKARAETYTKEKAERIERERIEEEEAEAKEKARQEALRPDREKLIKFADELQNSWEITIPYVESKKAKNILSFARGRLDGIASDIKEQAKEL